MTYTWTIPACIGAGSLTASNITSNSAAISWSASASNPTLGYEYLLTTDATIVPDATTVPTGSVVAGVLTKSFNGFLSPSTTYYYYISSVCSSTEVSSWTGSSFTTACANFSLPLAENFDSTSIGSSTNSNPPQCWEAVDSGAGYVYTYGFSSNS